MIAIFTMFIVYLIMKQKDVSLPVIVFTCTLMIIPYSFGQLLSYNMTYFAGGQYAVKILVPLLLLYLLNADNKNRPLWFVLAAVCCFLNLVCGVSGGPYTFLSGSLPVMTGCFFAWLCGKEKKPVLISRNTILCAAVTILSGMGVIISHLKNVGTSSMSMNLITFDQVTDSFFEIFRSYFEYLGSFPYDRIPVISMQGIMHTFRGVWALLLMAGVIFYLRKVFSGAFDEERTADVQGTEAGLIFVVLFNFIILWFTGAGTQPRYLAVTVAVLIILEGLFADWLIRKDAARTRRPVRFLFAAVFIMLILICALSDIDVIKGNCFPAQKTENEKIRGLIGELGGYEEKQVIFLDDTSTAEIARLMDYGSKKTYLAYNTTEDSFNYRGVIVNDYYMDITDASNLEDEHILVVNEDIAQIGQLPEYMADLYEEAGEYGNFRIYRAKKSLMDGVSGISYNDHAIDYCFTDGYEIKSGEIDKDGRLAATGDGGQVIASPLLGERRGTLDLTVYFDAKGDEETAGRIEVWDIYSHEMTATADLFADESKAEIRGLPLDGRNLAVSVVLNEGSEADIEKFEYFVR